MEESWKSFKCKMKLNPVVKSIYDDDDFQGRHFDEILFYLENLNEFET